MRRSTVGRPEAVTRDERLDKAILWLTLGALFSIPLIIAYFQIIAIFN